MNDPRTTARVLADSTSPHNVRLTTFEVVFPRFVLAEFNTHRALSRNSASSRAMPTEALIDRVRTAPYVPVTFNKRVKGMGVGDPVEERVRQACVAVWENAAEIAAAYADQLMGLGLDKSRANRLLEPFLYHTVIVSATEWDNFFGLRDHEAAQPEIRMAAQAMKAAMAESAPQPLEYGQWHLPLVTEEELEHICRVRENASQEEIDLEIEHYKLASAGRCARVSYDTHENFERDHESIQRAIRLMDNGHFSPFEHVARPLEPNDFDYVESNIDCAAGYVHTDSFVGNFRGWVQFRKEIPNESRFDLLQESTS